MPRSSTIRSGTAARSARYALRVPSSEASASSSRSVRFAIDDAISLLDHRAPDGLGQVILPRPWWAEKECVFPLRDEAAGRQLVDQRPVHLLVEIEIEGIEGAIGIAKARQFMATLEQRSCRRSSSSETSIDTRSMGVTFSVCAWRSRVSTAAMPDRRSWRSARSARRDS